MVWIFVSSGILAALFSLGVLTIRLPRLRLSRLRLRAMMRGCISLWFLFLALACAGLAMFVAPW
jgi:hypothetical protein